LICAGAVLFAVGLANAVPAQAQLLKKLKKVAEDAAEEETMNQVDRLVRSGVQCVFNDLECIRAAEEAGDPVVLTDADGEPVLDENGNPISDPNSAAEKLGEEPPMRPGEGVWANYDFVPGDRVLFTDDFRDDDVGDFPIRLEWVRGNMEIVEWKGRRLLRATGANSQFAVLLPAGVPERFTIEFDIHDSATGEGTRVLTAEAPQGGKPQGAHFNYGNWRGSGLWIGGDPTSTVVDPRIVEQIVNARIMADGAYVKAYINEKRISNVPRAELERGDRITFVMWGNDERPIYIGNIRIAEGGKDLYDDLAENGRVSTHGILFAVDSDHIRPESTPTLEEIGEMLQEHPDLRIAIEGHTDSTGDEDHNLELSQSRAFAVRDFLIESYAIEPDRLAAAGFGESRPVDENDTPEGRQNNRRVELVKLN